MSIQQKVCEVILHHSTIYGGMSNQSKSTYNIILISHLIKRKND